MNYIPPNKGPNDNGTSLYLELYSPEEQAILQELEVLFKDWHSAYRGHEDQTGYIIRNYSGANLSFDGFYPGYLKQRVKVLFIARESRGISGWNYLHVVFRGIKGNRIGKRSLNRSFFHSRYLKLAYALQYRKADYTTIPPASELRHLFGSETLSLAFMNISKLSNENPSWAADYGLINKSIAISNDGKHFIQEEIRLLRPDVIITMNLAGYFSALGQVKQVDRPGLDSLEIKPHSIQVGDYSALLLNTCHFSAVRSERAFFNPILQSLQAINVI